MADGRGEVSRRPPKQNPVPEDGALHLGAPTITALPQVVGRNEAAKSVPAHPPTTYDSPLAPEPPHHNTSYRTP